MRCSNCDFSKNTGQPVSLGSRRDYDRMYCTLNQGKTSKHDRRPVHNTPDVFSAGLCDKFDPSELVALEESRGFTIQITRSKRTVTQDTIDA